MARKSAVEEPVAEPEGPVVCETFDTLTSARLAETVLRSNGISVWTRNAEAAGLLGGVTSGLGQVELWVPAANLARARKLLAATVGTPSGDLPDELREDDEESQVPDAAPQSVAVPSGGPESPRGVAGQFAAAIRAHWRGQEGLGTVFFRNGVLVYLVLVAFEQGANHLLAPVSLTAYRILLVMLMGLGPVLGTWWTVGAWRSLGTQLAERVRRRGLVSLGLRLLVLSPIAPLGLVPVMNIPAVHDMAAHLSRDFVSPANVFWLDEGRTQLGLEGNIHESAIRDVIARLEANRGTVRTLVVASGGGWCSEAIELADQLQRQGVDTLATGMCASACTLVWLAGRRVMAIEGTVIGLHRTSDDRVSYCLGLSETTAAYRRLGLPESMISHMCWTPFESMWNPSLGELQMAGLVDEVIPAQ
jgi:hypothetical protein